METGISALEQTLEALGKGASEATSMKHPRNAVSEESVAATHSALSLAEESGDPRFLREAWHMNSYALTANEQWVEAMTYYRQAIPAFDQAGETQRAARMRLGFHLLTFAHRAVAGSAAVAARAEQIFSLTVAIMPRLQNSRQTSEPCISGWTIMNAPRNATSKPPNYSIRLAMKGRWHRPI